MNKKIIMPIALLALLSLAVFVSASMVVVQESGKVRAYEVEIQVSEGWNIISSGLTFAKGLPTLSEDSEIKEENIKAVYVYSNKINEYISNYPEYDNRLYSATDYFHGDEQDIIGQANLIYVDKSGSLKYQTKGIKNIGYRNLFSGWNFLSITPDITGGKSLDDLKGNCQIEASYSFDITAQKWTGVSLDHQTFEDYDLGRGIIIKVIDDCTLQSSSSSQNISLPELPESHGLDCSDSDGGKDYNTKGEIAKGSNHGFDECNTNGQFGPNPDLLREYFCNENNEIDAEWYTCINGCQNGACIQ